MYTGITVGCFTTIGNKHVSRGTPCEDASCAVSRNGVSVVCIADGAGGKQYTDARFGSQCAVDTIASVLCDHFDALYQENREAAVRGYLMAKLRVEFSKIMDERDLDIIDRLSCTLLFAAVKDRRLLIGHIGDGLIARVSPSGVSPFTMPQNDKEGKTFFVTAVHADNYMRLLKTTVDDCHAIALMTDGVQDSVYNEEAGLVKPVVAKLAETFKDGRQAGEEALKETVEKYIVAGSNVSDDASIGIMYFEGTNAPDAASLETAAEKFGDSDESFKELSVQIKPELIKAQEIIARKKQEAAEEAPETKPEENIPASEPAATAEAAPAEENRGKTGVSKLSVAMFCIGLLLAIAGIVMFILSKAG